MRDGVEWERVREGSAELDAAGVERWGRALGRAARADRVFVALTGPLGAGKTTLVRAACAGAGCEQEVVSPTYVLHRPLTLAEDGEVHHVDLYRLSSGAELDDLGWEELLASGEPVFVEWSERAGDRLPEDRWEVRLSLAADPARRHARARARGAAPGLPDPGRAAAGASDPGTASAEG